MRTFSGLLVLEDVLDYIPHDSPMITSLETLVFHPTLQIVEADCGTTLGKIEPVNYEIEGKTELATGLVISKARIDAILATGTYNTSIRTLDTCISKGGICAACYLSSHPGTTTLAVNSRVIVDCEYIYKNEVLAAQDTQAVFTLGLASNLYTRLYVFREGVLLSAGVDYTLVGTTLTLTSPFSGSGKNLLVRYMQNNRSPYLLWLSKTYAGSMLGLKPLASPALTLRPLLLASLLEENRLQLVQEYLGNISAIPPSYLTYCATIIDRLERALYMLALYAIFRNVSH